MYMYVYVYKVRGCCVDVNSLGDHILRCIKSDKIHFANGHAEFKAGMDACEF